MKILKIKDKEVLLDDDWYDFFSYSGKKVHLSGGYASFGNITKSRGGPGHESIHRLIMNCRRGDGLTVDHINMNPLDNRRCNLRIATKRQNALNSFKRKEKCTSIYKGVHLNSTHEKRIKKWSASIHTNGKIKFLGNYLTPEEAAIAYDKKMLEIDPNFSRLNILKKESNE